MAQTSLVDNLRPAARDQVKLRDRILRATVSTAEQGARGTTVLQWDMSAYASFSVACAGDSTQLTVEGSNDLASWTTIDAQIVGINNTPVSATGFWLENVATYGGVPVTVVVGNKQTRFVRVRSLSPSSSRNVSVTATLSQTPFTPTRPTKNLGPDNTWTYTSPSGGITNATAVTIRVAGNSYHRNLLTQLQLSNGGTTGTEVIITDTVGPTILWRGWLASGATQSLTFDPPLRGAAASSFTLTLSAASGAAVYANAQGLIALT